MQLIHGLLIRYLIRISVGDHTVLVIVCQYVRLHIYPKRANLNMSGPGNVILHYHITPKMVPPVKLPAHVLFQSSLSFPCTLKRKLFCSLQLVPRYLIHEDYRADRVQPI